MGMLMGCLGDNLIASIALKLKRKMLQCLGSYYPVFRKFNRVEKGPERGSLSCGDHPWKGDARLVRRTQRGMFLPGSIGHIRTFFVSKMESSTRGGMLRLKSGFLQIVVPRKRVSEILKQAHDSPSG